MNTLAGFAAKGYINSTVWMQIFSMQAEKEGVPLPQGPGVPMATRGYPFFSCSFARDSTATNRNQMKTWQLWQKVAFFLKAGTQVAKSLT